MVQTVNRQFRQNVGPGLGHKVLMLLVVAIAVVRLFCVKMDPWHEKVNQLPSLHAFVTCDDELLFQTLSRNII